MKIKKNNYNLFYTSLFIMCYSFLMGLYNPIWFILAIVSYIFLLSTLKFSKKPKKR